MKSKSSDVFVCYCRKDIEIARYCLDMFKKTNISAFTDLTGILAGEDFLEILQQHIVNCKIFLAIISNSTLKSKYSMREMLYAQKLGKIIIPIVLEDTILDDKYKLHFGYIYNLEFSRSLNLRGYNYKNNPLSFRKILSRPRNSCSKRN